VGGSGACFAAWGKSGACHPDALAQADVGHSRASREWALVLCLSVFVSRCLVCVSDVFVLCHVCRPQSPGKVCG